MVCRCTSWRRFEALSRSFACFSSAAAFRSFVSASANCSLIADNFSSGVGEGFSGGAVFSLIEFLSSGDYIPLLGQAINIILQLLGLVQNFWSIHLGNGLVVLSCGCFGFFRAQFVGRAGGNVGKAFGNGDFWDVAGASLHVNARLHLLDAR